MKLQESEPTKKSTSTLTVEMSENHKQALKNLNAAMELDPKYLKPVY
jgi:hypothetical protein